MFCFPISEHVRLLFQMSSYARANVRTTNEKHNRKIPIRASRGVKWENKMYKLKRSNTFEQLGKKWRHGLHP